MATGRNAISAIRRGLLAGAALLASGALMAGGAGTSGGLTLLEAAGARAAAQGEAFSAAADDVTASAYNPAAVGTLTGRQVSFSYQRGIADDASGRVFYGRENLGVGLSYYSAGNVDVLDGAAARTINAQTDLVASVAAAITRGQATYGAAFKFVSSELAEADKASAFAIDLGVRRSFHRRFRTAAALQNFGTELKFVDEGDPLPRLLRFGGEFDAIEGRTSVTFRLEAPYYFNESELRPALGAEARVGALAFRAGYRTGSDIEGLSLGTGFTAGGLMIDYSFGLVDDLDSRQRLTLGFKFGGEAR